MMWIMSLVDFHSSIMDTFGYWVALPIGLVQLAVLMIHKDALNDYRLVI
jgi:adenylate kinase